MSASRSPMRESHPCMCISPMDVKPRRLSSRKQFVETLRALYQAWRGEFFRKHTATRGTPCSQPVNSPLFGFRSNFPPAGSGVPADPDGR